MKRTVVWTVVVVDPRRTSLDVLARVGGWYPVLLVVVKPDLTRFLLGFDMFFGLGLCGHLSPLYYYYYYYCCCCYAVDHSNPIVGDGSFE